MKALITIIPLLLLLQIATKGQSAKRGAPVDVPDIRYNNLILQRSGMEYVQALDSSTKEVLWKKKIYNLVYIPGLERDVQWIFIDSMYLRGKELIIRNENKKWFSLDLQTLTTKKL